MIGQTISHYKILEKLGEGGMGVVYKAEDTKLKRTVALKFLPLHLTKEKTDLARFLQEAQAAAALNHPNVCTIYEINDEGENPFIVMEYVDGETLREKLRAKRIEVKDTIGYAIQIAEALKAAHSTGIIHRDIKSDNIMVMDDGRVKVMDFGLAKLRGSIQITKSSSTVGTLAYMAPEHLQGQEADARTDIFSFGVVLYEMLTGQLPFKGEYESAIMYAIINEEPKPVTHMQSGTPPEINVIVNRSLSKNVNERYQNMEELLEDLAKFEREFKSGQLSGARSDKKSFPSIAVLPFVNMSADSEQEYFCDGMSEEIINALTHIEGLHVVARTSAFAFKGKNVNIREIAKELHVDNILEGSVRKAGNRLRITAQLIKVANGYHLWSEKYDRNMEDIFDIQDEVTLAIVDCMKVKLLGKEEQKLTKRSTDNTEAYRLYLKGRYFSYKRTPEGYQKGIEFFNKAIETDPEFALPYVGLASLYATLGVYGLRRPRDVFPKAKTLNDKALEIDEDLTPAHCVKAYIGLMFDWDWPAAERDAKKAIELNPGDAFSYFIYALYLDFMGRFDEAITEMKKAVNLDPLSLIINYDMGVIYHCARRYDEAMKWYQKTLEIEPNYGLVIYQMGTSLAVQGNYKEAVKCFKKALKLTGGLPWAVSWLSYVYYKLGKIEEAENLLQELHDRSTKEYIHPSCFANAYSGLGDFDKAFENWNDAYEEREPIFCMLKVFPDFDRFRSDPRFDELLEKMNLK